MDRFNKLPILIFAMFSLFIACGQKSTDNATDQIKEQPAKKNENVMESISLAAMQNIWEVVDYMDLIMYNAAVSVSQDNQAAIRGTLRYISENSAVVPSTCKPDGRISFMAKGEIELEADIYFTEGCQFFLFIENQKPVYGNFMTPEGVSFFQQVVKAKPQ